MRAAAISILFVAAIGAAACTSYYDDYGRSHRGYGGYDYVGRDYDRLGNDCRFFTGEGGDMLDPWLACTREGQALVRDRYDEDEDRRLTAATADEANIWFRRHADTNRNMRLTDAEVKAALVNHVRFVGGR
jgi:opacity protein-like surface antigen